MANQRPLPIIFPASATGEDIVRGRNLSGTTAVLTGGYSGLGLEAARVLCGAGARVIVPARDVARARTATQGITGIEVARMDLMDPTSIDIFANAFLASGEPLQLLLNGAGIMAPPLVRDSRGFESQFSTNHLGHFQLTVRLWPALKQANGARIVAVSSLGHRLSPVDFSDPNFQQRDYEKWTAYGQSKTANALFAVGADLRGASDNIRAFSVHPGSIFTPLSRYLDAADLRRLGAIDENGQRRSTAEAGFKTVSQGAAALLWCALSEQLEGLGGVYCEDCNIARVSELDSDRSGVRPWATDPALAGKLWQLSERLTLARISESPDAMA